MTFPESSQSILAKLHIAHLDKHTLLGLVVLSIAVLIALLLGVGTIVGTDIQIANASDSSSMEESVVDAQEHPEDSATIEQQICVHITGAVEEPGMYVLDSGARVDDAVKAAGGFAEEASDQGVNLARKLEDGEQLIVPRKEEVQASQSEVPTLEVENANEAADNATGGKVNINTASAEELTVLKGVGEATAQKIISDRESNGSFKKASDIMRVSGIGEKKYQSIKDDITI